MGGGKGSGWSNSDLDVLHEKARQKIAAAKTERTPHIFISFAHEDKADVDLLREQAKRESTSLDFDDYSLKEPINSSRAEYIKSQIREKIDRASVTVVYLSKHSSSSDWVDWEISESLKRGKGVIGVYKGTKPPSSLPPSFTKNKCNAVKWGHAALQEAIESARAKR